MSSKAILLPALALTVALLAQTPQQPVIRVTTRLVEVNAIVRDKGHAVEGLTKDDFILLDNGKPQKIAFFSTSSTATPQKPPAPLPPNVFTNLPERGTETPASATVVLMDALNTPALDEPYARDQFVKFLKQLHPEDRVAVYALGRKLAVLNDFTNDARRLLASLDRYKAESLGAAEATDPTSPDYGTAPIDTNGVKGPTDAGYTGLLAALQDSQEVAADFATLSSGEITAAALEAIANHLASLPGRKSLIWITSAIPLNIDAAMRLNKSASSDRRELGDQTYRAVKALNDADIAVYPVDARGLVPGPNQTQTVRPRSATTTQTLRLPSASTVPKPVVMDPSSNMSITFAHDAMIGLAKATGGLPFYNTNDIKGAIRKAVDDSEFTYNLGFYPGSSEPDSSFHEIKLRVKGKSYEVRSRNGYRAGPVTATTEQQRMDLLRDALWSPIPASGIALAVRADKVDEPKPGSLHLTLAVAASDFTLQPKDGKWSGALDYVIAQRAADGRFLTRVVKGLALNPDQEQYRRMLSDGVTISNTVEPLPAAVQIRIVLLDRTSGKVGSVIVPLGQ
ncbi:MAG: VWA domain-containing protein [Bryobacteraceae bacterium]